jgi:diguanylate cyclase (GGDEF)-like protein/PAS domain S-box-containing protein
MSTETHPVDQMELIMRAGGRCGIAVTPARAGPDDGPAARSPIGVDACHTFACAILDGLTDQIAVLAPDGTIVAVNAAWRSSVPEGAAVGANYLAVCPAGGRDSPIHGGVAGVLAGAARYSHAYACEAPSGQRWYHLTVTPLGGGWQGAVVAQADITAQRLAEADLRIAAIAFESPDGMMVTDAEGRILRVNQAFSSITGYSAEDVVGRSPSLLRSGRHDAAFYRAMWDQIARAGSWEGEIWNRRKNGEVYPELLGITAVKDPGGNVSHYVASLTDITVSKAASDEIKNLAFYDPLTGLPNRRLLLDRLRQVLAAGAGSGRAGALMFIDLDHFKKLNDTLGHNMGDLLLQQVAGRLQGCLRQGDTVARLGGDEFVVLVEGLSGQAAEAAAQTETLAAKILAALNAPYVVGPHQCRSTPSIGAALFHGSEHPGPDQLLMQADIAMYQAKEAGRNSFRFFDQHMQDTISERVRLEDDLRLAIEREQFELYYQVQVDADGRARGAEALLRWVRPDGVIVSPADFIDLAEETGLILPLGDWVLQQACAQLHAWQQNDTTRGLVLAINVSARQFHQSDFCDTVRQALAAHEAPANRLKLELTEGMLLDNVASTIASMQTLKQLGVRFSLDDFGTGYSSLQYLKRLPLDQLKIDQSFVRELVGDASDQAIVLTIIAMARSLGLDVIAEGVETLAQRTLLEHLGCRRYQGYLYSRPLPVDGLVALLGSAAHGELVHANARPESAHQP